MASAMTVKIQDGKGDYIVINAVDFDPDTMKKFDEGTEKAPAPKKRGRPKKAE
jgi:hypothetical protein